MQDYIFLQLQIILRAQIVMYFCTNSFIVETLIFSFMHVIRHYEYSFFQETTLFYASIHSSFKRQYRIDPHSERSLLLWGGQGQEQQIASRGHINVRENYLRWTWHLALKI